MPTVRIFLHACLVFWSILFFGVVQFPLDPFPLRTHTIDYRRRIVLQTFVRTSLVGR